MTGCVLDASAVLACLQEEPGEEMVRDALPEALLSAANAAEVVAKLIDRGDSETLATFLVLSFPCEIVSIDADLGLRAGRLHAATRKNGLSLGDCMCLALAQREGLPALTADRAWGSLSLGITVTLIR